MAEAPQSVRLLSAVGWRLRVRGFERTAYGILLAALGIDLAALAVGRLTGFGHEWMSWEVFVAVPALGFVLALVLHRRPKVQDAARAVDQSVGAQDLFLTLSLLDNAAGEYQPLVVRDAENRAVKIRPAAVVPFAWQARHWHIIWLPAAVVAAMIFLPQLDPFGQVEASTLTTRRKERLLETRRETQLRIAEVQKAAEEGTEGAATDKAVDDLKMTFNKMQPQEKRLNLESLMDEQKRLGELWRKLSDDELQNLMKTAQRTNQQFGSGDQEQMKKWTEELQAGSTDGLKDAMKELKDELQQLAKTEDPVKKEELKRDIQEKLKQLEKFAEKSLDNKKLAAALQRAKNQLDLSSLDELSDEALEAAMESLELSEMELEQLAEAAKDLKRLEEALKTLQSAKRLNEHEKLDGEACKKCNSMADYAKLYQEMLAQCQGQGGEGPGQESNSGMKGPGTGKGGVAPEADDVTDQFQTELSKSAVAAGKVLMSMSSQGKGEKGNAVVDYKALVQQVRQGASEALQQEQVPPGYHEGIKSYFDALKPAGAQSE